MIRYSSRRRFLSQVGLAGAGIAAASVFALPSYSQTRGRTARATLGLVAPRADFNPRLFGAFLEHLGRSIYTGVYDPGNSLSDERGFRKDVIKEVADLHVPIAPVLLGGGERLFDDVGTLDGYACTEVVPSPSVAHFRLVAAPGVSAALPLPA